MNEIVLSVKFVDGGIDFWNSADIVFTRRRSFNIFLSFSYKIMS